MSREQAARLADALGGLGGAPPRPGVVHVVAVPRFAPQQTSLRAAVVAAGADELRVDVAVAPDALAAVAPATASRTPGGLQGLDPATVAADRVLVQLVPAAVQTAPALVAEVARLRTAGCAVEVVPSTGTVEGALVLAGVGLGTARSPDDGRLDAAVLAHDRPDLKEWRDGLVRRGQLRHTPVRLVTAAGTPQQQVVATTVARIVDHAEARGPFVAVVGDDVTGPEPWADDLPLRGLRVLNPRAPHQAAALDAAVRALGGEPVPAPLLGIEPGDVDGMRAAVRTLAEGAYELLGLTSPNGVDALADAVAAAGLDARALAGADRVACVGPGTAARLRERLGVVADLVPTTSTTAALADAVGAPRGGARALLPRADLATEVLREGLVAAGWSVDDVTAYRTTSTSTLPPAVADALARGDVPLVPVLSSSMARALVEVGRSTRVRAAVVAIGPVTAATLREHDVEPTAVAERHDLDGLVDALVAVAGRLATG